MNNAIPLERIKETIGAALDIFGPDIKLTLEVGQVFVKTSNATWIVFPDVYVMELLEGGLKVDIPGWSVVRIDYTKHQKTEDLGIQTIPKDVAWTVLSDMLAVSLR
jgi:hypothetical protein